MSKLITIVPSTFASTSSTNGTTNLYRRILAYIDLPEPLFIAIIIAAILLILLIFILVCSRFCCHKCRDTSTNKDKYKLWKMDTGEIDKVLDGLNQRTINYGDIYFSLEYDVEKCKLYVVIIKVDGLPKPFDGRYEIFVVLQVRARDRNLEKKTTKTIKDKMSPVFDEKFCLEIECFEITKTNISFKVFDNDRFGCHSLLGEAEINTEDFDVTLIYYESAEFHRTLKPGENVSMGWGQICVVLNNSNDKYITLTILEARHIRVRQNSAFSHVFVTVKLKNKHFSQKWKTKLKKRTKDCPSSAFPYFNESFILRKPDNRISDCRLIIKLWMSGMFKVAACIGYVELGSDVDMKLSSMHWNEMLDSPRHPIAKWHTLQDSSSKEKP